MFPYTTTSHSQERLVSLSEYKHNLFSKLYLADCIYDGEQGVIGYWLPTPDDLERLKNGSGIYLIVLNQSMSPSAITTNTEDLELVELAPF